MAAVGTYRLKSFICRNSYRKGLSSQGISRGIEGPTDLVDLCPSSSGTVGEELGERFHSPVRRMVLIISIQEVNQLVAGRQECYVGEVE